MRELACAPEIQANSGSMGNIDEGKVRQLVDRLVKDGTVPVVALTLDDFRHAQQRADAERRRDDFERRLRHDPTVVYERSRPLDGPNLLRTYYRVIPKAGLPRIRFHDLRHTAATLLLLQGVPAKIVSEMLGHANIAITLDLYSHVLPDMQEQAAAAMEDILTRRRGERTGG